MTGRADERLLKLLREWDNRRAKATANTPLCAWGEQVRNIASGAISG